MKRRSLRVPKQYVAPTPLAETPQSPPASSEPVPLVAEMDHASIDKFVCRWGECTKTFSHSTEFVSHVQDHVSASKGNQCEWKGCQVRLPSVLCYLTKLNQVTKRTMALLIKHTTVHTGPPSLCLSNVLVRRYASIPLPHGRMWACLCSGFITATPYSEPLQLRKTSAATETQYVVLLIPAQLISLAIMRAVPTPRIPMSRYAIRRCYRNALFEHISYQQGATWAA
jgi:hypothetical protein